ncbi:MAG: hypothetical protein OQK98_02785 [Gammaproteobacteria bacterium]|nr:hypothetical protein [Gammaproteobacteria bacterium]
MRRNHRSDVNFAIYDKGELTEIIQPDHIGLIGVGLHVDDLNYDYPKDKTLEIGMIGSNKMCQDENRVPVIVSLNDGYSLGLRLKDFNADKVERWSKILDQVYNA